MQKGNRAFEVLEFKNYSGTNDFYSNPEMNSLLGEADHIIVHTPIWESTDRKSTRLNSSHKHRSRMPSSA